MRYYSWGEIRNMFKRSSARLRCARKGTPGHVDFNDEGFGVQRFDKHGEPGIHVRWADVSKIVAYKRDLGTIDSIYLVVYVDSSREWIEMPEELDGFQAFQLEIERRFQISDDWWSKVAFPPFAPNETILYDKI